MQRSYNIDVDVDSVQLALHDGTNQVGGAYFPVLPGIDAEALAFQMGEAFKFGIPPMPRTEYQH